LISLSSHRLPQRQEGKNVLHHHCHELYGRTLAYLWSPCPLGPHEGVVQGLPLQQVQHHQQQAGGQRRHRLSLRPLCLRHGWGLLVQIQRLWKLRQKLRQKLAASAWRQFDQQIRQETLQTSSDLQSAQMAAAAAP
jgi:hypothetical protein